ncbi:hypothetical protein L6164_008396 [Bauhinia variegata]|uniref:Uncharacterized protein n=1 Tax=Bauhinia variegata TaxID=167791 RepID=A0ACB9PGB6_BAUVA|nr:hypothetical protein L6164_008396 [Bauhinia variegata]
MKTLISASNPLLSVSHINPWKPNIHVFHPKTIEKLSHPLSTLKPHANAKGFSGRTGDDVAIKQSKKNNDGDGDDEIPQEVYNKMILRICVSVGVPMALGLAFLHIFGVLRELQIWDAPKWVPFLTSLTTFGASTLGIAYGALSTSLDRDVEGSFLGLEEVQKNWVETWKEEDESKR